MNEAPETIEVVALISCICPRCRWNLHVDKQEQLLTCMNGQCELYGTEYEFPRVTLKRKDLILP